MTHKQRTRAKTWIT